MKKITFLLLLLTNIVVYATNMADTLVVHTINYESGNRDTVINFPDDPGQSFRQILMAYNMRCKDGNISVPGNTNYGCGEWDYSCNTYVTDSSRTDSVLSFTASHSISGFTGTTFPYLTDTRYNYQQFRQYEVTLNNILSEEQTTMGTGSTPVPNALSIDRHAGHSQFLYTASDLIGAGLTAGAIDAILLEATGDGGQADHLRIAIKPVSLTSLETAVIDTAGLTTVFYHDYVLIPGTNRIQFHTSFNWDGTSSLLIDISFTNNIPSGNCILLGEQQDSITGLTTSDGNYLEALKGYAELPATNLSSVDDQITVSFWSRGNANLQPVNNSILYGMDDALNRQLNIHLPWSNANVYFDCGYENGGYDRINKVATASEYEGEWSFWTFTKDVNAGIMTIYRNGEPWLDGSGKTKGMDFTSMIWGSMPGEVNPYAGSMDDLRVWDTVLDESTIKQWMYRTITPDHPAYAHLMAYFPVSENDGEILNDPAHPAEQATIVDYLYHQFDRGNELLRGIQSTSIRPVISFCRGSYDMTVTENIVTDSSTLTPSIASAYEIIPRYGSTQSDSINQIWEQECWSSGWDYTFNPEGLCVDSVYRAATDTIEITQLSYYNRYPGKYELMSFVTPYGIYLDLGMEGKTWLFDVTDFAPVLHGSKRITIERGGQWQEDMDIQFLFIEGTPPRDVLDIQQIWRNDYKGYTSIIDNTAFEPRQLSFRSDGHAFMIRSVITGHGQEGEFIPRQHWLNVDGGDPEFTWTLWKECSENPIFPQGGTWIYDRAGWCPGAPSDLHQFDLSPYVNAGETHEVDYGMDYANGTSNYIVNHQLVTYGAPHFNLDAALLRILQPNGEDAEQIRANPACIYPQVVIQNTGSTALQSLVINYYTEGGENVSYTWTGDLNFLEQDTVNLPIPELTFWLNNQDIFHAEISAPNGGQDENPDNNHLKTTYADVDVYPYAQILTIQLKTNNFGNQTSYTLFDESGDIYYQRNGCESNTVYNDDFILTQGCYRLRIDDSSDNGLDFWAQPNQGSGYFRILDQNGGVLHTFDPDFGGYSQFDFAIGAITGQHTTETNAAIRMYPVPAKDLVNIDIDWPGQEVLKYQLIDISGQTRQRGQITVNESGTFRDQLLISGLSPGLYMLILEGNNGTVSDKLIIR